LQKGVAHLVSQYRISLSVAYRLLDVTSELGELTKEVLKETDYDTKEP